MLTVLLMMSLFFVDVVVFDLHVDVFDILGDSVDDFHDVVERS